MSDERKQYWLVFDWLGHRAAAAFFNDDGKQVFLPIAPDQTVELLQGKAWVRGVIGFDPTVGGTFTFADKSRVITARSRDILRFLPGQDPVAPITNRTLPPDHELSAFLKMLVYAGLDGMAAVDDIQKDLEKKIAGMTETDPGYGFYQIAARAMKDLVNAGWGITE